MKLNTLGPVPIKDCLWTTCRQLSLLVNRRGVVLGLGLLRTLLGLIKVDVFDQLFYDDNIGMVLGECSC